MNVRDFGAVADGATNDTDAIQAALNAVLASPDRSGEVYFPQGIYRIDGQLDALFTAPGQILLRGEPGAILDGTTSVEPVLLKLGGQSPDFRPEYSTGRALLAPAVKGEQTLRFDTTGLGLARGDLLLISTHEYCDGHSDDTSQRWSPRLTAYTTTYYKGELVELAQAPDPGAGILDVVLKSVLFDSYDVTGSQGEVATKVYKLTTPVVSVQNLEIRRDSNQTGLSIAYARNVLLDRCQCSGARYSAFQLAYVYGGTCSNNAATDFFDSTGVAPGYGLAIDSSQYITTFGNRLFGGRHALKHGGWEPVRCVIHTGNTLDNHHLSTNGCLDFHDNTDFAVVVGNTILNGIASSCRNIAISHNVIMARHGVDGLHGVPCVGLQPSQDAEYQRVTDNQIISPTVNGVLLQALWDNVHLTTLDISRNTIRTAKSGIEVSTGSNTGLVVKNVTLQDNDVVTTMPALALGFRGYRSDDGQVVQTVQIDRLSVTGGRYQSLASTFFTEQLTRSGTLLLRDVNLAGGPGAWCLLSSGFRDALVDGCTIENEAGSSGFNRLTVSGDIKWLNTTVRNFGANGGIELTGATLTVQNNTHENCTGTIGLRGQLLHPLTINGSVTTTTPVPTNVLTYDLPDGVIVEAWATIVGRRADGRSAIYKRRAAIRRVNGDVAALIGSVDVIGVDKEDVPSWNVALGVVGMGLRVLVHGENGPTISWFATVELTMFRA